MLNVLIVVDIVYNKLWKVVDNMCSEYKGDINWYYFFVVLMCMDVFFNEVYSLNE